MWDQADPVVGDACPYQIALLADGRHDKSIHSAAVLKIDVAMGIRDQSDTQFSGAARARCAWTTSGRNKLISLLIRLAAQISQVPITAIASTHRLATPANSLAASKSRWQIACTSWPRMAISSVKSTKCRSAPPKPFESITWLMRIVAYLAVCRSEGKSAVEDHLIASNPPNGDDGSGG